MYRYILFDLDGTLTDPKEGITKCVQYALKYFGIEADTEDLVDFIGPPLLESFQKYYHLPKSNETDRRSKSVLYRLNIRYHSPYKQKN